MKLHIPIVWFGTTWFQYPVDNLLMYITVLALGVDSYRILIQKDKTSKLLHNWCLLFCIFSSLTNTKLHVKQIITFALLVKWSSSLKIISHLFGFCLRLSAYTWLFYNTVKSKHYAGSLMNRLTLAGLGGTIIVYYFWAIKCILNLIREVIGTISDINIGNSLGHC